VRCTFLIACLNDVSVWENILARVFMMSLAKQLPCVMVYFLALVEFEIYSPSSEINDSALSRYINTHFSV
jgi:hypothetical protein